MKLHNTLALAVLLFCSAQNGFAVKAYPGVIKAKQADGTEISIRLHGSEHGHYTTTVDGYPLIYNEATNNYEYATIVSGKLKSSGIVATNSERRSPQATELLKSINKETAQQLAMKMSLQKRVGQQTAVKKVVQRPKKALMNNFPHFGEQHSIVILMEFNDKSFSTMKNPKEYYDEAMNKEGFTAINGATGSARDFFIASSHGQFKPTFDVYGPVKINYGQHDAGDGTYNTPINMGTFVKAVVEAIDDEVDFSQYDHDGDGNVDNIYIYYAGKGSADSNDANTIWPHAFTMNEWGVEVKTKDGVNINSYTCSNEEDGLSDGFTTGIGTFVHEFGHCLGFMDLYDTNGVYSSYTPGSWDTMCSGSYNNNSNTPPLYSSYECYELGWLKPEVITRRSGDLNELPYLGESNKAYMIQVPGNENEYYLLENRQKKGWDAYLPGSGMLVWHIDYDEDLWRDNKVNTVGRHQRVDIVEANGRYSGTGYYQTGVPFPGSDNVTEYSFKSWDAVHLLDIDKISDVNGLVSFYVKGADSGITKPELTASNERYNGFDLSWNKVEKAENYLLNVKKVNEDNSLTDLEDYTDKTVTGENVSVEGLEKETTYQVSLASCNGSYITDADTKEVKTTEKFFTDEKVKNIMEKDVTMTSFSASWDTIDGAQDYVVNLEKVTYDGEKVTSAYDFTDRMDGMPAGWETNCKNFSSSKGTFGETAPSLKMTANGNYLTMSLEGAKVNNLNFWYYVSSASEGSTVEVQALRNGQWITEKTIDASEKTKENLSLNFNAADKVRLLFNRTGTAYVVIDDVSISGNKQSGSKMDRYTEKSVGEKAEASFDGLEKATTYCLTVYGVKNGEKTITSDKHYVTTADDVSGINSVNASADAAELIFDISGRRINNERNAEGILIKKSNGKTVKTTK